MCLRAPSQVTPIGTLKHPEFIFIFFLLIRRVLAKAGPYSFLARS
jgi:hypothetical protein